MTLLKPLVSEQSLAEATRGRYSFVVEKGSRRPQIRKAVEKIFGVTVTEIETTAIPAKTYRSGRMRQERLSPSGRKAVVTLAKGQKIDLFEVGSNA